jgi:hypothetical protein
MSFLNMFFKIMHVMSKAQMATKKTSGTQFSENDEIIFYLAALSKCEQGGGGSHMGLSSCRLVKIQS